MRMVSFMRTGQLSLILEKYLNGDILSSQTPCFIFSPLAPWVSIAPLFRLLMYAKHCKVLYFVVLSSLNLAMNGDLY